MEEVDGLMLIHHLAAFVFCILIFCILVSKATVGCSVFRMEEEIKCVQYSPPTVVLQPMVFHILAMTG